MSFKIGDKVRMVKVYRPEYRDATSTVTWDDLTPPDMIFIRFEKNTSLDGHYYKWRFEKIETDLSYYKAVSEGADE